VALIVKVTVVIVVEIQQFKIFLPPMRIMVAWFRICSISKLFVSAFLLGGIVTGWRDVTKTITRPSLRIVGGNAVDPQRYPYFALLERTFKDEANNDEIKTLMCGGILM
jgi:hypothetical protein